MTIEQILEILENYKLRIPPTVFYDLKADIVNFEEPTTKNDLGIDCISREQAIEGVWEIELAGLDNKKVVDRLKDLPSVTPQEPRRGHWIVEKGGSYLGQRNACCSNCKDFYTNDWNVMNYCPNCGANMREVKE